MGKVRKSVHADSRKYVCALEKERNSETERRENETEKRSATRRKQEVGLRQREKLVSYDGA